MKKKNKEIDPKNDKGDWHGYQEWYWDDNYWCDGVIWVRAVMKNGNDVGYTERHRIQTTNYYIR